MASMFQSLLDRTTTLPTMLLQLLNRTPSATSSSSSSTTCTYQIEGELGRLRRRTERILATLNDAEEKEVREESVRLWLAELRDVAYDSQDVLDEVEYELLRHQLEREEEEKGDPSSYEEIRGIKGKKVLEVIGSSHVTPAPCPPLLDASFQQQIIDKIKQINDLFDEIYKDGLALKLHEEDGQRHGSGPLEQPPRMPTSCFLDEQGVRGRDEDKVKVIRKLLSDDDVDDDGSHCTKENVRVVSIVGMGGLGKTTLAQLVYNDNQVVGHFSSRSWVCVSDSFDVVRLTKEIVQAVLGGRSSDQVRPESGNLSVLQQRLREELQGRRFLLVLDDVWNERQNDWEALWVSLSVGAEGSRVLLTTRSEKVSRISRVNPENMHRLGCLPEEDCWSLFEQRAFGGRSSDDFPELVAIGRELVIKKCKGVPLTVKTLAGLLFCEFRKDRWMDILKSELWDLPEGKDDILPALKLSYHRLPSPLKPCFAYCAVFPKDQPFGRGELVRMWMAHGYIKPSAKKCVEDVGREYVEDLLQRSLFQEYYGYAVVMHDLIHDLAMSIWGGECCEIVDGRLSSANKSRHLLFNCWEDLARLLSDGSADSLKRLRSLRTCKYPWKNNDVDGTLHSKALDDMLSRMQYLRVLDLGDAFITKLPDSVGNLKHLRYLSICGKHLVGLPDALGNLLNLETLEFAYDVDFEELPKRLRDLVNLRYFNIQGRNLSMMPRGIGRLTQLRTLPLFVVGEGGGAAGIEELASLNDLQGSLEIRVKSLSNWVNYQGGPGGTGRSGMQDNCGKDQVVSILKNKRGLESLVLDFSVGSCSASIQQQQQQQQENLLESVQPHTNIRELEIRRYVGGRFPKWMEHASSSGLKTIRLHGCDLGRTLLHGCQSRHLPTVGQLFWVKHLEVTSVVATTNMVCEFLEGVSFPSLEGLILQHLWKCEGLTVGTEGREGAFPCLRHLTILACWDLEYVKLRHLTALRELHIEYCRGLRGLDFDGGVDDDGEHEDYSALTSAPGVHIPHVDTMTLRDCPNLNFSELAQKEQQQQRRRLPPSLRRIDVSGSPLLGEWVRSHDDELMGVTCSIVMDDGGWRLLSLRNVQDVEEARARGYLLAPYSSDGARKLELRWDDDVKQQGFSSIGPPTELGDQHAAHKLLPNTNLMELTIQGYRGRSFPDWVGDPGLLSYLVKMTLSGCVHCDSLPPLGGLPSLEHLHISRMPEVRRVGWKFHGICGSGGVTPFFRSLRTLEFYDMPHWVEWQQDQEDKEGECELIIFPVLQALRIFCCPNLNTFRLIAWPQLEVESDTLVLGADPVVYTLYKS